MKCKCIACPLINEISALLQELQGMHACIDAFMHVYTYKYTHVRADINNNLRIPACAGECDCARENETNTISFQFDSGH